MGSSHVEVNDMEVAWHQSPEQMDARWAEGWRHFGPIFFRYSSGSMLGHDATVWPLRLPLAHWTPKKSQRRILNKNNDLTLHIHRAVIDEERRRLFQLHKSRFTDNVPEALEDFLGPDPGKVPCRTIEVACHLEGRLVAASYLDVGQASVSSIYAFFDPAESWRSLGIYTMLIEMLWAKDNGYVLYYPGYAYDKPSVYDYKKGFLGLERFEWGKTWVPMASPSPSHESSDRDQ